MGSQDEEDYAAIIRSAIQDVGDEEDGPSLNLVSNDGLVGGSPTTDSNELPYVLMLQAAVSMVKTGEITMDQYVEGVLKLDAIADNALKIYAIPAVKNDLPGKLSELQNQILEALEVQLHVLKEGLATLLAYPETLAIGDLEVGLETAVGAYHAMADIQKNADAEYAAVQAREKEEKAQRAQRAAATVSDDSDS